MAEMSRHEKNVAAQLFATSLHDSQLPSQSDEVESSYAWGCPSGRCVIATGHGKVLDADTGETVWGWDMVRPGGICEQVFSRLGVAENEWRLLKALPGASDTRPAGQHTLKRRASSNFVIELFPTGDNLLDAAAAADSTSGSFGSTTDQHAARKLLLALLEACVATSSMPNLQSKLQQQQAWLQSTEAQTSAHLRTTQNAQPQFTSVPTTALPSAIAEGEQATTSTRLHQQPTSPHSNAIHGTDNEAADAPMAIALNQQSAEQKAASDGPAAEQPQPEQALQSIPEEDGLQEFEVEQEGPQAPDAGLPTARWFDARCRMALRRVADVLDVPLEKLLEMEASVAAERHLPRQRAQQQQQQASWMKTGGRYLAIGGAAAAGGLLLAVTGGLAAPLVAAGVGAVFSAGTAVVGLGAIGGLAAGALTGFVGSTVGFSLVVAGLGYAGGSLAGSKLARRLADVQEFGFWPLDDDSAAAAGLAPPTSWHSFQSAFETKDSLLPLPCAPEPSKQVAFRGASRRTRHRLSVTLCVGGWATHRRDMVVPWGFLSRDSDTYAMVWESDEIVKLQEQLRKLVSSAAGTYAAQWFVCTVVSAAVAWPWTVVAATNWIDGQWSVVMGRAKQAGVLLALALMAGSHGDRPVTLVGYSMGARVIFFCLQHLAAHGGVGIVENAVLLGAPVPGDARSWKAARRVVAGRLVNGFSRKDWVMGLLYRSSSGFVRASAGLQPVNVAGVEDMDLSMVISTHVDYITQLQLLLDLVQLE